MNSPLTASAKATNDTSPDRSLLYDGCARFYDYIFEPLLTRRIRQALQSLGIEPGASILDVGIGTGNYLSAYPRHARVLGIDIAQRMLDVAAERVFEDSLRNVSLRRMSALDLDVGDDTFDYVMGFHAISVVDSPQSMLREMLRVCKPGGRIVIINHFSSEHPWIAPFSNIVSPITSRLGWRANLRFSDLFREMPIRIEKQYKTSRLSLFTVIVGSKPDRKSRIARSQSRMGGLATSDQLDPVFPETDLCW